MTTERDTYNACVQMFIERDYDTALMLAQQLAKQGASFLISIIFLLIAQHLKKTELVIKFGDHLLRTSSWPSWERAIVNLILGNIEPHQLLSQAKTEDQRCQAHYYIGARKEVEKDIEAAYQSFKASVGFSTKCVEHKIAQLVIEQYRRFCTENDEKPDTSFKRSDETIWELDALLEKLFTENKPEYVYRGQIQDYGTILPSGYRALVDMTRPLIKPQDGESLHNRGRIFRPLLPHSLWPESGRKLIDFVSLCRAQLGYLPSQLFCQHCCLPTEGIDVTDDIDIATFFAIFDYNSNNYVDESKQPGVVIRIDVGNKNHLSLRDFKEIDFYSCPFYVSGIDFLNVLGRCQTSSQSKQSFGAYFDEKLNLEMTIENWEDFRKSRPFELIALPESEVSRGRVMMQRAGLVLPDALLPRLFEAHAVPPPPGKTWDGPQCIEDLAHSDVVEMFLFRHHSSNRMKITHDPTTVFPEMDPIRSLLSVIISAMSGGKSMVIANQDTSVFSSGDEKDIPR